MNKRLQVLICIVCISVFPNNVLSQDFEWVEQFDYFHPRSTLEAKTEGNTRIYTFNPDTIKNISSLNYNYYDPFPLIVDDSLIVMESVRVNYPFYVISNSDQIMTSISISSGKVNFAREIIQPKINPEYFPSSWESIGCDIRGVYKWNDRIVVVISYDNIIEDDPNDHNISHVYIYDKYGWIESSFPLDGFGIYGIGVVEEKDHLVLADYITMNGGSLDLKKDMGLPPQIWKMDLNSGEIVIKHDFDAGSYFPFNPEGYFYYISPDRVNQEKLEYYSLYPLQKISEIPITKPFYPSGHSPKYWRGLLWDFDLKYENENYKLNIQAYNPETLEPVEADETPLHFIHKVDGVPYLIERFVEYNDYGRGGSIHITKLESEVDSWQKH